MERKRGVSSVLAWAKAFSLQLLSIKYPRHQCGVGDCRNTIYQNQLVESYMLGLDVVIPHQPVEVLGIFQNAFIHDDFFDGCYMSRIHSCS